MTLVRRESLAEQAADVLLARIRAGEWAIGGKLPGETTLAAQLDIGRSTAREAIRILAGRGILATRQGAGIFVTSIDVSEGWDAVVARASIVAVIEARTAIEVEAAALAAERRSPDEVARLREALDARDRHRAEVVELVKTDMSFHRGVVVAAHSPILLELFDSFAARNTHAMIAMLDLRGAHGDDDDQDVHERIYSAIASQQSDIAAALTRSHLHALRQLLA